VVVVAVVRFVVGCLGCSGCFSTARYDDAHAQRVADIDTRYQAEHLREQEHLAALALALVGERALLIPIEPIEPIESGSSSSPVIRVDARDDIMECRRRCDQRTAEVAINGSGLGNQVRAQCLHASCEQAYLDALTETYFEADVPRIISQQVEPEATDLEAVLALAHNRAVQRRIDEKTRNLAQIRQRLEEERQAEIAESARRRDLEIASGRAAHRARVQAAAHAFAATDRGPAGTRPLALCAAGDPGLRRVAGCLAAPLVHDEVSAPNTEQTIVGAP
jgi:hypothetical protein